MTLNPTAIRVLCFGDSNTWGQRPDKLDRYPANIRWTGKLQESLGGKYEIIEEGLGGRTVNLDHRERSHRNGRTYFLPCVDSHSPFDVLVLMLGTNDLKIQFQRSPQAIADGIGELVQLAKERTKNQSGEMLKTILMPDQ